MMEAKTHTFLRTAVDIEGSTNTRWLAIRPVTFAEPNISIPFIRRREIEANQGIIQDGTVIDFKSLGSEADSEITDSSLDMPIKSPGKLRKTLLAFTTLLVLAGCANQNSDEPPPPPPVDLDSLGFTAECGVTFVPPGETLEDLAIKDQNPHGPARAQFIKQIKDETPHGREIDIATPNRSLGGQWVCIPGTSPFEYVNDQKEGLRYKNPEAANATIIRFGGYVTPNPGIPWG